MNRREVLRALVAGGVGATAIQEKGATIMRTWVLFGIVALAVACGGAAPTVEPDPADAPPPAAAPSAGTIERLDPATPWREYQIPVPKEFVRNGFNAVELRFATAASPAEVDISRDARELAVRFDRIEFLRKPSTRP